ncbi:hypothetical protein J7S33_05690, partial [Saccharothrix algeriensis]
MDEVLTMPRVHHIVGKAQPPKSFAGDELAFTEPDGQLLPESDQATGSERGQRPQTSRHELWRPASEAEVGRFVEHSDRRKVAVNPGEQLNGSTPEPVGRVSMRVVAPLHPAGPPPFLATQREEFVTAVTGEHGGQTVGGGAFQHRFDRFMV